MEFLSTVKTVDIAFIEMAFVEMTFKALGVHGFEKGEVKF